MRVRMRAAISGTRNGVTWPPIGGEIEVGDEEGAQLCAAGMATPIMQRATDHVETAVAPTAEVRRGPGRPRKTEETI